MPATNKPSGVAVNSLSTADGPNGSSSVTVNATPSVDVHNRCETAGFSCQTSDGKGSKIDLIVRKPPSNTTGSSRNDDSGFESGRSVTRCQATFGAGVRDTTVGSGVGADVVVDVSGPAAVVVAGTVVVDATGWATKPAPGGRTNRTEPTPTNTTIAAEANALLRRQCVAFERTASSDPGSGS